MKRLEFIISLLLVYQISIYASDTLSMKYYPLQIGNSWTYFHVHVGFPSSSSRYKTTIIGTTNIGGHLYYITSSGGKLRIDSLNGKLLVLDSAYPCPWLSNERLIDSLQSRIHDSSRSDCLNVYTKCLDTSSCIIFGLLKPSKTFNYNDNFETSKFREYTKDIGLTVTFTQYGSPAYDTDTLKGCVINGVIYGDTSITGLQPVSTEIPEEFSLSQNYPNPFNPVTKIKFRVSSPGVVKIAIFDVLGKEIAVILNEQLAPGSYETEWDGTNYQSGVYFSKLITDGYSDTKKIVLLK